MGKIQKLETLTALQIAAGEVIDRPAAVVRDFRELNRCRGFSN